MGASEDDESVALHRSPIWKIALEGTVVGIVTGFVGCRRRVSDRPRFGRFRQATNADRDWHKLSHYRFQGGGWLCQVPAVPDVPRNVGR